MWESERGGDGVNGASRLKCQKVVMLAIDGTGTAGDGQPLAGGNPVHPSSHFPPSKQGQGPPATGGSCQSEGVGCRRDGENKIKRHIILNTRAAIKAPCDVDCCSASSMHPMNSHRRGGGHGGKGSDIDELITGAWRQLAPAPKLC